MKQRVSMVNKNKKNRKGVFMEKKVVKSVVLLTSLLLAACGETGETSNNAEEIENEGPLQVVATSMQVADLLENIGGEHLEIDGMMGPGVDPHDYVPSASDVELLNEADIVAYNGLLLEEQFVEVFDELEEQGANTIIMSDAISESEFLDFEEDEDLDYDPHIWFSVENWKEATEYTAEMLATFDPSNAEDYQNNAEAYITELDELSDYIESRVEEVPEGSRYLVTAHDAFQYFGQEFGFEVVGLQGISTQTEAGAGDISEMADFLVENQINAVFVETSISPRNIEALIEAAESQGHEVENAGELYSDALGIEEEDAHTYIKMYEANIDTIVDALTN